MAILRLPGLIDAHVHFRDPGYTHKEDFTTGTAAALAGGITTVLDMPNTDPPTSTPACLVEKAQIAAEKALCDVALFVGATNTDPVIHYVDGYLPVAQNACGLKIYVNETFGSLRIEELGQLHALFRTWAEKAEETGYRSTKNPSGIGPIAVHAEEMMVAVCLNLSQLYHVPLHVVHVSRRSEIELIARAKECGQKVTCEVTPHHLFLNVNDLAHLGTRGDMRPPLASPDDVDAMWEHLTVVDIFATDHAPHTIDEKNLDTPPPGVPGIETMLPLLVTAVHHDRLTIDDILERCVHAPRRIYHLPEQPETEIEVDVDAEYELSDQYLQTKAAWTPFFGQRVFGRVERVKLRGKIVYDSGKVIARPGSGRVLFQPNSNRDLNR
ncbi:dihydroorotase [Chloroflexi bacterium TSY]|nr:dihydroorotase [Chloroflexi bacterium TSY]